MRRGRAKLTAIGAALAISAVAAGCGGGSSPGPGQYPADFFGVNGVVLRAWSSQGREALVDRQLASVESLGIAFVRAQLGWQQLEPEPPIDGRHRYDFADADRWVAALASHGLRWYVFGVGLPTPSWAAETGLPGSCAPGSPPVRPADFATAMAAVARRYGPDGTFWAEHPALTPQPVHDYEVWNAPNHGGDWCPQPDPAAYGALYAATRAAIHAVDPGAEVIVGGLGTFPETSVGPSGAQEIEPGDFLTSMLSATPSLQGRVDAVGAHVYAPDGEAALATIAALRGRLDEIGLGSVPISWNEVGWPTRGSGGEGTAVSEEARASYLGEVASADLRGCGVSSLAPHTWVSAQRNPLNPEDWFGIANPATAEPYPSALAYAEAIRRARAGDTSGNPCG